MKKFEFAVESLAICSPQIGEVCSFDDVEEAGYIGERDLQDWLPDVSFIPKRAFRRLSRLSKMSLFAAHHAAQGGRGENIGAPIFCTAFGEYENTAKVLESIYSNDLVSPMDFSYSVHNTGQGLFSILNKDVAPATVISSHIDALEQAMVKAFVQLENGDDAVLLVYQEDEIKGYNEVLKTQIEPLALGVVLTKPKAEPKRIIQLKMEILDGFDDGISGEYSNLHQLSIAKILLAGNGEASLIAGNIRWVWSFEAR